eukprot:TRINITY_DN3402_c0_g1_i1.p2 TRINITY_DN3402_c0_g1~~TRINITY_DN3402_c0_g1_i1.p2  ORF type:complete len:114 (+),score=49.30 TRINITY_DN3402_c0_g1_i1:228-569(+)
MISDLLPQPIDPDLLELSIKGDLFPSTEGQTLAECTTGVTQLLVLDVRQTIIATAPPAAAPTPTAPAVLVAAPAAVAPVAVPAAPVAVPAAPVAVPAAAPAPAPAPIKSCSLM